MKTFRTQRTSTFFDFLGLKPTAEYSLGLSMKTDAGNELDTGVNMAVTTRKFWAEFVGVNIHGFLSTGNVLPSIHHTLYN